MNESKKQRSYSGCVRCKRRRQKCNELKPACTRCVTAGTGCEYEVKLKWGGRKFERSRFGTLEGVEKIANAADGFVYAASKRGIAKSRSVGLLLADLELFPALSVMEKSLLYHFTDEASRVTCCHASIQRELCQLVVSTGIEVPCLLYATLAWAAIHLMSITRCVDRRSSLEKTVARFKVKSIQLLRRMLKAPDAVKRDNADALLATVRTLCQCEIHSGTDGDSVWRVHVKGAKALMAAINPSDSSRYSRSRLLSRWYASLESLAMLTPSRKAAYEQKITHSELVPESVYLDDYNGYSTDLSLILGNIGSLAESLSPDSPVLVKEHLREKADELEGAIYSIMERDNGRIPEFYPGVAGRLSQDDIKQYSLCNESYQHTALIHINRQLRGVQSNSTAIQQSVKSIIKCASSMAPTTGLSPLIVMTTPLFTAGCEALDEDRIIIQSLLETLYDALKIRNIKLGIEILQSHWAGGEDRDWKELLRMSHPLETLCDEIDLFQGLKKWDFIPY